MYAIIEDSGTQIKVAEGDVIKVALRDLAADVATLTFDRVLLVGGDEAAPRVGQPVVEGAKVTADILSEEAGEKVLITKFRRRKGYKRLQGHRQKHLKVKITSIQG